MLRKLSYVVMQGRWTRPVPKKTTGGLGGGGGDAIVVFHGGLVYCMANWCIPRRLAKTMENENAKRFWGESRQKIATLSQGLLISWTGWTDWTDWAH